MFKDAMRRFELTGGAETSRLDAMTFLMGYVAFLVDKIAESAQKTISTWQVNENSHGLLSYGLDFYLADWTLSDMLGSDETDKAMAYAEALFGANGIQEFAKLLDDAMRNAGYTRRTKVVYVAADGSAPGSIQFV